MPDVSSRSEATAQGMRIGLHLRRPPLGRIYSFRCSAVASSGVRPYRMSNVMKKVKKTTVGKVHVDALAYTAGDDAALDTVLIEADCIGTAAHVTMLARMPLKPKLFSPAERTRVVKELVKIIGQARKGAFKIRATDQDVHMAVERHLIAQLGDLGKRVHTGRSRNDQVAVDIRLYARDELSDIMEAALALADILVAWAAKHEDLPMVGRTHMQPAMPSSVGLWASAHAEALLEDVSLLTAAYDLTDRSPLGSAAGYGVPLPIDRALTAKLLGFGAMHHNVLHASNTRGKCESIVLSALAQVMITLSRLAQDLMLYTMPEFGYFTLPAEYCTGSSIMPQKKNPDVLELLRARAIRIAADASAAAQITASLPSGYSRDLQETKALLLNGLQATAASIAIMQPIVRRMKANRKALANGFTPEVFATDRALELMADGTPFRDAYRQVKDNLDSLADRDPQQVLALKTHVGAPAGLDLTAMATKIKAEAQAVRKQRQSVQRAVSRLLGVPGPRR